jgi:hypothetical protein
LVVCSTMWAASEDPVGTWEGESKCTVPDSPCHDEQALYRFTADKNDSAKLSLDAYKVVNGTPEFIGTLACEYRSGQSTVTCTGHTAKQDEWEFHISGDTMTGTLKIGSEKTLYRRITLRRARSKES